MKDQRLYLIHIKECIEKIEQYTENGELSFSNDPKTQDAVIRNFEIIGEARMYRIWSIEKGYKNARHSHRAYKSL